MSTPAVKPNSSPNAAGRIQYGPEIANAWGWLLARAPRIARQLEATPGSTQVMANILAGFDLFCRRYDLTTDAQMSRIEREVSYNEATDIIICRQSWH
jgi:hypothetical protein